MCFGHAAPVSDRDLQSVAKSVKVIHTCKNWALRLRKCMKGVFRLGSMGTTVGTHSSMHPLLDPEPETLQTYVLVFKGEWERESRYHNRGLEKDHSWDRLLLSNSSTAILKS